MKLPTPPLKLMRMPPGPALRFESHAYLPQNGRPDPSERDTALRVVDEKSWPGAVRHASRLIRMRDGKIEHDSAVH